LWLIGITNALNILDVYDGLATGVAAIAAFALAAVAVLDHDWLMATTALALSGSLVGFWRYNRPPAKIFLGDTGSLFVGLMLAGLTMIGAYTRRTPWAALAPLAILLVPILETILVVLARGRKGLAPWRGSPDHFALRLRHRGWRPRRVLTFAYALGGLGAVSGVAMVVSPPYVTLALNGVVATAYLVPMIWLAFFTTAPAGPESGT
jgi:UDP-GlcNAc:undecaprenyl-phosphate GlcNAc-1-phosphate transferase